MAALSRFISRLGEKALPLYRLLRRTEHFEWTDAATAELDDQSHIGNKSGPGRAQHGRTNAIIHRGNQSSHKRGARCRTRNGRTQVPSPETSLLRVHCPNHASHGTRIIKR